VIRECLKKSLEDSAGSAESMADVIFVHDELYDSGTEGIEDKLWS
jgi:hypothetical protein